MIGMDLLLVAWYPLKIHGRRSHKSGNQYNFIILNGSVPPDCNGITLSQLLQASDVGWIRLATAADTKDASAIGEELQILFRNVP